MSGYELSERPYSTYTGLNALPVSTGRVHSTQLNSTLKTDAGAMRLYIRICNPYLQL